MESNTDNRKPAEMSERQARKVEERRAKLRQSAADREAGRAPARKPVRRPENSTDTADRVRDKSKEPGKDQNRRRKRRRYRVKPRLFVILFALILLIVLIIRSAERSSISSDFFLTDEGFTHSQQFMECAVLHGIDVSEHQGDKIKWKKVKSSGVDYVFVRAGYRDAEDGTLHVDSCFESNMKGADKAGVMTGAYFFSQATTPEEAQEEADFLLDLVEPYNVTMPLVIDFEIYPDGRLDKKIKAGELYAASFYHDIVLAFCRKVQGAGYESAVYANKDMLTHYMDASILDDDAVIWVATYSGSVGLDADYMFWQCSDKEQVGGISGNVDHDMWYVEPNKVYKTRGTGPNQKNRISIGECRVSFQRSETKLKKGRAIPKLALSYEGNAMRENRDYSLSVVRNTKPDKGYIIVKGLGKYKNWMMVPFKIED